jgi:hypothetical protein
MGVTIVPFSALTPLPGATIRSLDPPELRDLVVVIAAPHDDLLRRFVADLKRRGLPDSCIQDLGPLGAPIRTRPPDGDAGRRVSGSRTLRARTMTAGG